MERPPSYGTFHIVSIIAMILITAFLCIFCRKASDKKFRTILLVFWILLILLEIYKEVTSSISSEGNTAIWHYCWAFFPFQFCDAPFYLLPMIIFLKDGKLRDAAMIFLATYTLFAGAFVMAMPGDVFVTSALLNVQTMFHHGTQVALGAYIFIHERKRLPIRSFLYAILLFVGMVATAQILNAIVHHFLPEEYFDLYYISPYFHREYPWVGALGEKLHWTLITLIYLGGMTAFAFVIFIMEKGLQKLIDKNGENKGS